MLRSVMQIRAWLVLTGGTEFLGWCFRNDGCVEIPLIYVHHGRLVMLVTMVQIQGQTESRLWKSDQQTVQFWKLTGNSCDRINNIYTKVHLKVVAAAAAFCSHSLSSDGAIGGQKVSRLSRSKLIFSAVWKELQERKMLILASPRVRISLQLHNSKRII